jgi:biopolymer transport protein ExbD
MAIFAPGKRVHGHGRRGGRLASAKRNAVAVLQLTAMVDMFTVMTVFLLQNYATTNQVLPLDESVNLPQAQEVKELKPSNVVVLTTDGLSINNVKVADFHTIKEQQDWLIKPLAENIQKLIQDGDAKKASMPNKIRDAVAEAKGSQNQKDPGDDYRKITVQADKTIDFLTVKKVMYTVTEAGVQEINFAVLKKPGETSSM